jgi:hypothetical protein
VSFPDSVLAVVRTKIFIGVLCFLAGLAVYPFLEPWAGIGSSVISEDKKQYRKIKKGSAVYRNNCSYVLNQTFAPLSIPSKASGFATRLRKERHEEALLQRVVCESLAPIDWFAVDQAKLPDEKYPSQATIKIGSDTVTRSLINDIVGLTEIIIEVPVKNIVVVDRYDRILYDEGDYSIANAKTREET